MRHDVHLRALELLLGVFRAEDEHAGVGNGEDLERLVVGGTRVETNTHTHTPFETR